MESEPLIDQRDEYERDRIHRRIHDAPYRRDGRCFVAEHVHQEHDYRCQWSAASLRTRQALPANPPAGSESSCELMNVCPGGAGSLDSPKNTGTPSRSPYHT